MWCRTNDARMVGCLLDRMQVAELLVRAGKRVLIRDREMIIAEVRRVFGRMFEYQVVDTLA